MKKLERPLTHDEATLAKEQRQTRELNLAIITAKESVRGEELRRVSLGKSESAKNEKAHPAYHQRGSSFLDWEEPQLR